MATEQEREPVQVRARPADVVAGMADEAPQRRVERIMISGQPDPHELQQLGEFGRVRHTRLLPRGPSAPAGGMFLTHAPQPA